MQPTINKDKKFAPMKMPSKKAAPGQEDEKIIKQNNLAAGNKKVQAVKGLASDENIEFQGKTNKQSIAQDIMRAGYIQSYVDFFYVTNNTVPSVFRITSANNYINPSNTRFEQNEEQLTELKTQLMDAEESTRYQFPDKSNALEGYLKLAEKFYHHFCDYAVSAFFYKRVIEISKQNQERQYEGKGKMGFGMCHYQVGLTDQAITILEGSMKEVIQNIIHIKKSEELGIVSIVEQISSQLIQIYKKVAGQYERADGDQISQALMYYEKCREVAQKANQSEAEGQICHKIGLLYLRMGNLQRSIQYQSKFLEITKQSNQEGGKQREMEGHASLAKCYLKKGDTDDAQTHLEEYHRLARDLKQNNSQSDAALYLAKLYHQKGNIPKSLEFYQQHFDCARTEKSENKDRKLVDRARVTYGLAKANSTIEGFIKIVANSDKNIKPLLDWKSKREK